jgi:hypothetical protein
VNGHYYATTALLDGGVPANDDVVEFLAPTDRACRVVRIALSTASEPDGDNSTWDAQVFRATTSGSTAQGTLDGPNPLDPASPASGVTVEQFNSGNAGGLTELFRERFNFWNGWRWDAGREGGIVFEGTTLFVLRLSTREVGDPTNPSDLRCTIIHEE